MESQFVTLLAQVRKAVEPGSTLYTDPPDRCNASRRMFCQSREPRDTCGEKTCQIRSEDVEMPSLKLHLSFSPPLGRPAARAIFWIIRLFDEISSPTYPRSTMTDEELKKATEFVTGDQQVAFVLREIVARLTAKSTEGLSNYESPPKPKWITAKERAKENVSRIIPLQDKNILVFGCYLEHPNPDDGVAFMLYNITCALTAHAQQEREAIMQYIYHNYIGQLPLPHWKNIRTDIMTGKHLSP